jgi:hypothetical protein
MDSMTCCNFPSSRRSSGRVGDGSVAELRGAAGRSDGGVLGSGRGRADGERQGTGCGTRLYGTRRRRVPWGETTAGAPGRNGGCSGAQRRVLRKGHRRRAAGTLVLLYGDRRTRLGEGKIKE